MTEFEEYKAIFVQASEIAKSLPSTMQEVGFSRALDLLLEQSGHAANSAARPSTSQRRQTTAPSNKVGKKTPKASKASGQPKLLKDLNLKPSGKKSFAEFVEEKKPTNNNERHLLSVYYLSNVLELPVTADHVYSCFRDRGWPAPKDFANSLQVAASRKAWIDTGNGADIRVAIPGENHVEYEMPVAQKK